MVPRDNLHDTQTRCPHCECVLRIATDWFGKSVACPRCNHAFTFASVIAQDTVNLSNSDTAVLTSETAERLSNTPPIKPPSSSPVAGKQQLGRYKLRSKLGEGGFGLVYLARDEDLGRDVAIKLPRTLNGLSHAPLSGHAKERFLKEARAAAKLRHPNIVAVFDRGQSDEDIYIVYEYVPGRTLDTLIAEKAIDATHSIQLVASLADALSYAASENIVHRDIKPANIMIDGRKRPQIMDFGLAEALSEGMASSGGRIAGTPAYMSPEQARGEQKIGPATDQYSLGAILYELATGRKAVLAQGRAAIHEVSERVLPPLEPLQKLPKDLQCIILRAMNAVPSQRYKDCADFASDLRAYLAQMPVTANPLGPLGVFVKWAQRNRSTALASVISLLLIVAVAVISSLAAVMLQQRERMLSSSLATTRIAQQQAEANAKDAEAQRKIANDKAELARRSQLAAEAQKQVAEEQTKIAKDALAKAIEAQIQRETAERLASDESMKRKQAVEEVNVAREELQLESQKSQILRYSETLAKAATAIQLSEPSTATQLLADCAKDQRGWEWNWLTKCLNGDSNSSYQLVPLKSRSLRSLISLPVQLSDRPMYMSHEGFEKGSQATYSTPDPPIVSLNESRDLGLYLTSDARVNVLTKLDLKLSSQTPVTTDVVPGSFRLIGGGKYVAFTTIREERIAPNAPQTKVYAGEIWATSPTPVQRLKFDLPLDWITSCEFLEERNAFVCALDSKTLRIYSMQDQKELQTVSLKFDLRMGPHSLFRLKDGRLAMLDKANRIQYVDPRSAKMSTGNTWASNLGDNFQVCRDSSGRYLALFNTPEIKIADTSAVVRFRQSLQWQLVDTELSASIGVFSLPSSEPEVVAPIRLPPNYPKNRPFYDVRALAIAALETENSGDTIAIRDSANGLWCWHRQQRRDLTEVVVTEQKKVAVAAENGHVFVCSDGMKLGTIDFNAKLPEFKGLRRSRGASIVHLAVEDRAGKIATIDRDGLVATFVDGRPASMLQVPGAQCAAFVSSGDRLIVGTRDGGLVTLNTTTGDVIHHEVAHTGAIGCVVELPNLNMIASVSEDTSIKFWDSITGLSIPGADSLLPGIGRKMIYHRPSQRLAVFSDTMVSLFLCKAGMADRLHDTPVASRVEQAVYLPDGKRIVVANDRLVSILNAEDGRRVFSLPIVEAPVQCLSTDGNDPRVVLENGKIITWRPMGRTIVKADSPPASANLMLQK